MKWLRWFLATLGVALFLLGGLWLLQGLGWVHVEPIACVGECETLDGPSTPWAIAGAMLALIGASVTVGCVKQVPRQVTHRPSHRSSQSRNESQPVEVDGQPGE